MNCRVCPPGNVMLMSFSLGAVDLALGDALEGNRWSWQSDLSVEQSWSRRWRISEALCRDAVPIAVRLNRPYRAADSRQTWPSSVSLSWLAAAGRGAA